MERLFVRALSFGTLVLFALVAARLVAQDRRYSLLVAGVCLATAIPALLSRRRMRRLLHSGDVPKILGTWEASLDRVTHPETMAPIMTATAYAAYGFIEEARTCLARAARGPAWDAAIEQRLFVEALLDVYEGERDGAQEKARALVALPLPRTGFWMRRKIALLRRGTEALTRAFKHAPAPDDEEILLRTSKSSPLVYWAMRYARAILLVDRGRATDALALIADAPPWPEASAFRVFHEELVAKAV